MRKPGDHSVQTSTGMAMGKLRKGLWSPEEDDKLMRYMMRSGHGCWSDIARNAGLLRCGKSCRLRWINYLRPDLKRGAFSPQEEDLIVQLHSLLGNRYVHAWVLIIIHSNIGLGFLKSISMQVVSDRGKLTRSDRQ